MRLKDSARPIFKEARRYLANAEEILRTKAGRDNGQYKDPKYVKMAGNTAWNGVLVAVDAYLASKGIEKLRGRKTKAWYNEHLSRLNRKINSGFNVSYSALHLSMGYDGLPLRKPVEAYLEEAYRLIEQCEKG